jgi:hypothetical protein
MILFLPHAGDLHVRVLGPDHPATLTSRNNLANAYQAAGDGRQIRTCNPSLPKTLRQDSAEYEAARFRWSSLYRGENGHV